MYKRIQHTELYIGQNKFGKLFYDLKDEKLSVKLKNFFNHLKMETPIDEFFEIRNFVK